MRALIVATLATLLGSTANAATYQVDNRQSVLVARTYKAGIASGAGHEHAIRATQVQGTVEFVPGRPQGDKVEITVQTATLSADDPTGRQFARLPPNGPSESQRAAITKGMLGKGQLNAAQFPTITFRSTRAGETSPGNILVDGELTLHGVTRPFRVNMRVRSSGARLIADGQFDIKQTDFGIKPYGTFMGAVKNQDRITLILHVVATR
ncbi:MAG: YceI family protein [Deltaproteobacteria bacterium]|nr:YceI family protein [Deltaproteobacteria bacterium]